MEGFYPKNVFAVIFFTSKDLSIEEVQTEISYQNEFGYLVESYVWALLAVSGHQMSNPVDITQTVNSNSTFESENLWMHDLNEKTEWVVFQ